MESGLWIGSEEGEPKNKAGWEIPELGTVIVPFYS